MGWSIRGGGMEGYCRNRYYKKGGLFKNWWIYEGDLMDNSWSWELVGSKDWNLKWNVDGLLKMRGVGWLIVRGWRL